LDFVSKPFDSDLLLESVRNAIRHAEESGRRKAQAEQIEGRLRSLTLREAAILTLLAEGYPSKVIAAKLEISVRTAEHHRAHIVEKMQHGASRNSSR
jgi:two-component system response regulator FixJ